MRSVWINFHWYFFLLLTAGNLGAQPGSFPDQKKPAVSDTLLVSLLTYSPGSELYTLFGHSALRIRNTHTGDDEVYNYGTFDFEQPHFYPRFIQGNLLYCISSSEYKREMRYAKRHFTRVIETPLTLDDIEKRNLLNFLNTNLLPENRNYRYDFLYDNCATRLLDVLERVIPNGLSVPAEALPIQTFRQLLHHYTRQRPWSELGIDLLMGLPSDRMAQANQVAFLPDYLYLLIKNCHREAPIQNSTITEADQLVWESHYPPTPPRITPVLLFSCLALLFLFSAVINSYFRKVLFRIGNALVLLIGLISLVLLYLWLGTEHYIFRWNTDLVWANPLVLVAFFLRKKSSSAMSWFFGSMTLLALFGAAACLTIQHTPANAAVALATGAHFYALYRSIRTTAVTSTSPS